jgi:hypothetical protein
MFLSRVGLLALLTICSYVESNKKYIKAKMRVGEKRPCWHRGTLKMSLAPERQTAPIGLVKVDRMRVDCARADCAKSTVST